MTGHGYAVGTSDLAQWVRIVNAVETSPWPHERILDVGAGWGKAEVLLREMLNVKPLRIDAVEANPTLAERLTIRYDAVYRGDVRAIPTTGTMGVERMFTLDQYDTVLMCDVIEHLPYDDGVELIARIPGQIVVSTPVDPEVAVHEAAGDDVPPLERHVSWWGVDELRATGRLHAWWRIDGQIVAHLLPI